MLGAATPDRGNLKRKRAVADDVQLQTKPCAPPLTHPREQPPKPPFPRVTLVSKALGDDEFARVGGRLKFVGPCTHVDEVNCRYYFDEVFIVDQRVCKGDCVLVASPAESWVARVEAVWSDDRGDGFFTAKWYYSTKHLSARNRWRSHDRYELFESVHTDTCSLDSVDQLVQVLPWEEYVDWLKKYGDDASDDVFGCRLRYLHESESFEPLAGRGMNYGRRQRPMSDAAPGSLRHLLGRLSANPYPRIMPGREDHLYEITSTLRYAIQHSGFGGALLLVGVPGTGKTSTLNLALRTLSDEQLVFNTVFVNAMKTPRPSQLYALIWESVTGEKLAQPIARRVRPHLPYKRLFSPNPPSDCPVPPPPLCPQRFFEDNAAERRVRHTTIVIIDEFEYVAYSENFMYTLLEWAINAGVALVFISNKHDFFEWRARITSRAQLM
eukprot:4125142-Pleurochrysis_carterae.AAC.3